MLLKFILTFFIIGFVVSLLSGIIAQNGVVYILMLSGISGLVFGFLGFGVFMVLEKMVPEVFQVLGESSNEELDNLENSSMYQRSNKEGSEEKESGESSSGGEYSTSNDKLYNDQSGKGSKPKVTPDSIVINDIVIKNEPKLMAEAIRTMMSTDDDETG
ncbi:MAG: hypothetical protein KDK90_20280 [Leptospiraceae bacterium]|nr:hypothetical protein [Leptospiraceae bacterium]